MISVSSKAAKKGVSGKGGNANVLTKKDELAKPVSASGIDPDLAIRRRREKLDERRQKLRDELWPNTSSLHYSKKNRGRDVGFTTIPRTLSLICTLIAELANSGAADVYVDLWSRSWDDGMVVIDDEATAALASGFKKGTRHARSWQDRMRQLEKLGFILVRPKTARSFGYVLLVHPHYAAEKLRAQGRVSNTWWDLFQERLREIGAGPVKFQQLDREYSRAASGARSTQ
jgi:hypothetical protein